MVLVGGNRTAYPFYAIRARGVRHVVVRSRRAGGAGYLLQAGVQQVRLQAGQDGADVRRVGVVPFVVVLRVKVWPRGTKGARWGRRVRVNGALPTFVRPNGKIGRVDGRQAIFHFLAGNAMGGFHRGGDSD